MCVEAAQRRLALLFTTPPERYVPIDPDDLEEIAQL
jgi:hypothetical protein